MIEIRNLEKFYGKNRVLNSINLSIKKGEFITLLGASGSGKSTLLKILSSRESFSGGSIFIDKFEFKSKISPHKSRQLLTQNYSLMPWFSALNNIKFAMKCAKKDESRAGEFLSLVGLSKKENSFPSKMSGGENQRVAIARALALEPEILLMDEPFSALDPIIRLNLQKELKVLTKDKTVIFVTHDADEAMLLADRIVVLKGGDIVFDEINPKLNPRSLSGGEYRLRLLLAMAGESDGIEYSI